MPGGAIAVTAEQLIDRLEAAVARGVAASGGSTEAVRPGDRVVFHWPPHPVSYEYHLSPSDWVEAGVVEIGGDVWDMEVARTEHGFFGRVVGLWNEARAEREEDLPELLRAGAAAWVARKEAITEALGRETPYRGPINELGSDDLVCLLYSPDRDVAYSALLNIEKRASQGVFLPAFLQILGDVRHPMRRVAQWCVLDALEDPGAFCKSPEELSSAVAAVRDLIYHAPDDYARTVYKAGVVLGGHVCNQDAADALLTCFTSPSKYGRRSAYHAVFHLVEWLPGQRHRVVHALRLAAQNDPEELLREFAASQARDIAESASDHVAEPVFPEEL